MLGAERRDASAYVDAMQPVLGQNMELTREFVDVATLVKRGDSKPADIAARFEQTLVPGAARLRDAVDAIEPETPELAATHELLVRTWTARAEVYEQIHDGWTALDPDAFDAAVARDMQLKDDERQYFEQVAQLLAAQGLALDAYP